MKALSWAVTHARIVNGGAWYYLALTGFFAILFAAEAVKVAVGNANAADFAFLVIDPVMVLVNGFIAGVKLHERSKARRA